MIKLPFEDSIKGHLDYIKQTIEGISKGYQILLEGKIPLADIKITQEGIKVDRISMETISDEEYDVELIDTYLDVMCKQIRKMDLGEFLRLKAAYSIGLIIIKEV